MKKGLLGMILVLGLALTGGWMMNHTQKDGGRIFTALPAENNAYYKPLNRDLLTFNADFRHQAQKTTSFETITKRHVGGKTSHFQYDDVWLRDVAPVVTDRLVKFRYSPDYLKAADSKALNTRFNQWLTQNQFKVHHSNLILDGGNFIYNGSDTAIITTRILKDNPNYSRAEIVVQLKRELGLKRIILITPETGDVLAHADGMVHFISHNTLFISDFLGDKAFGRQIRREIHRELPNAKFITMKSAYTDKGQYDPDIASAKGLYINLLTTKKAVFVPQFGLKQDKKAVAFVKRHTNKQVIPVALDEVSTMGGAVNCLSWYVPSELLPAKFKS